MISDIDAQICRLLALRQRVEKPAGYDAAAAARTAGVDSAAFAKVLETFPKTTTRERDMTEDADFPVSQRHISRLITTNGIVNRGLAWSNADRERLGIHGLLPYKVNTIEEQLERIKINFLEAGSPIQQYKFLSALQDRNESLYYRFLVENVDITFPIVYTPTVGEACQKFSRIFSAQRGLYINYTDKGRIADVLKNWHEPDVRVIVVTDGERILGLGDLGSNGMGIPIGKLALYCACAGIKPWTTLPITLDVGCDVDAVREDPLYNGLRQKRVRGEAYTAFVDEFVAAVKARWPHVLLQWEDFGADNAYALLGRNRDRILSFNDDIQGTATVVLAALRGALRVTAQKLKDQRLLFYGAGSSATGVAELISSAVALEEGIPITEARKLCVFVDRTGAVCKERTEAVSGQKGGIGLMEHKLPYCHDIPWWKSLDETITEFKPTALFGLSTTGGAFTEAILKKMDAVNAASRPIIFSLSNPTSKSECTAEQAYKATNGRALFASGSPFDTVVIDGKEHYPRQANNAYIFPGLGLGLVLAQSTSCPDELFHASAKACAEAVTLEELFEHGALCPRLSSIRDVSANIAFAVVKECVRLGLATRKDIPASDEELRRWIKANLWEPDYRPITAEVVDTLVFA